MNDTNQGKILDKVRRILARADEARNDNEHERAIALRQAHALLAMHGLAMADVNTADEARDELGAVGRGFVEFENRLLYPVGIYTAIARLNGCAAVKIPNGKAPPKLAIIGRRLSVSMTRQIGAYVVESVRREAATWGLDANSYGVGAWAGVSQQVDLILLRQAEGLIGDEQVSRSNALVITNQYLASVAEATTAMRGFYPTTKPARRYASYGNPTAQAAGRSYGEAIGLNGKRILPGGAR